MPALRHSDSPKVCFLPLHARKRGLSGNGIAATQLGARAGEQRAFLVQALGQGGSARRGLRGIRQGGAGSGISRFVRGRWL